MENFSLKGILKTVKEKIGLAGLIAVIICFGIFCIIVLFAIVVKICKRRNRCKEERLKRKQSELDFLDIDLLESGRSKFQSFASKPMPKFPRAFSPEIDEQEELDAPNPIKIIPYSHGSPPLGSPPIKFMDQEKNKVAGLHGDDEKVSGWNRKSVTRQSIP